MASPEITILKSLREQGWRVAVHNDYRLNGKDMTFWLFTHSDTGRFVKGEAATDLGALRECELAASASMSMPAFGNLADDYCGECGGPCLRLPRHGERGW